MVVEQIRLESLTVHQYRGIRESSALYFSPGHNVLLGPNGAGKSTLLNLISMITSGNFALLEDETERVDFEFKLTLDRSQGLKLPEDFDVGQFETQIHITSEWRLVEHDFETPDPIQQVANRSEPRWSVSGYFKSHDTDAFETPFSFSSHEDLHDNSAPRSGGRVPQLYSNNFFAVLIASLTTQAHQQQIAPAHKLLPFFALPITTTSHGGAGRFDEGLETFQAYTEAKEGSPGTPAPASFTLGPTVTHGRTPGTRISLKRARSFPMSMLSSVLPDKDAPIRSSSPRSSISSLEDRIAALLDASRVTAVPIFRQTDGDDQMFEGWTVHVWFSPRRGFHHNQLSFGQKRALAFLWYCDVAREWPIIADELVNGLHHSWIQRLLSLFEGRQSFLATQNPLLLDFLHFESVEHVQRTFILCDHVSNEDENSADWTWRNMSRDEALDLFSAYEVGIQHVSNILQTKGLW